MNTPIDHDDAPDELTTAYRRSSAADGGRPSAATRAAIMAEARRVAAWRATETAPNRQVAPPDSPAANDSWWNWKAVASIAVLGLVGVLAVRSFRTEPLLRTPEANSVPAPTAELAPLPALAPAPAPTPMAAPVLQPQLEPQRDKSERRAVAAQEAPAPAPAPAQTASMLDMPAADSTLAASARGDVGTALMRESDGAIATAGGMSQATSAPSLAKATRPPEAAENTRMRAELSDARVLQLMERYFPAAFGGSADAARAWILFDQQDEVLRTGTYRWTRSSDLEAYLVRTYPGIRLAAGTAGSIRDAAGRSADYAFYWLAADSAPLAGQP